jgi:hypothetical protein
MSLSIVLGIPTTAIRPPRSRTRSAIVIAPRSVPSPPITNKTPMLSRSRQSTIASGSWLPRDVPKIVPPSSAIRLTTSGVRSITSWP